jgi:cyclopropane-fatty-acyl-phospholipid synthase
MAVLDRLLRAVVRYGPLTVIDARGTRRSYGAPVEGLRPVTVRIADRATEWAMLRRPSLAMGEAYMDARLTIEDGDVRDLHNLLGGNFRWDADGGAAPSLWRPWRLLAGLDSWNRRRRSRRNVAHHYDLSDRLYDLFLDADRQYSCAYFASPEIGLDRAQQDKKAHIAAKLVLAPGQRVLDIGCGWGGMALYLNQVADVDVLGITLSQEQLKVARRRAAEAGVADRVRFELIDYRDVAGTFDRIVSVGMFEHVGPPHYRAFFHKCRSLLAGDGVMLLHSIGRADGPAVTDPWVAKYIFPGGRVPALSEIAPALEHERLWLTDLEVLRLHYARTLDHWYDRVQASRGEIEALYDARFLRMWEYYLAGAAAAFRYEAHAVFQLQLARRQEAVPLTRDYMARAERRFRAEEGRLPSGVGDTGVQAGEMRGDFILRQE